MKKRSQQIPFSGLKGRQCKKVMRLKEQVEELKEGKAFWKDKVWREIAGKSRGAKG